MHCDLCHESEADNVVTLDMGKTWVIVCDDCNSDKGPKATHHDYSFELPKTMAEVHHWDEHLLRKIWVRENAEAWGNMRRRIEQFIPTRED